MAVCKNCGCAIPLGNKSCDICATLTSIAPSQSPSAYVPPQPVTWNVKQPSPSVLPQSSVGPQADAASIPMWNAAPVASPAVANAASLKAQKALRRAFWLFVIVGGLSVGVGLLAELGDIGELQGLFNWYSVGEGAAFLVLAFFTWRGSLIAAIIGTGLYVLDTVLLLVYGYFSPVRVVIIIGLGQAILTAYQFRQQRLPGSAQVPPAVPPDQTRVA